MRRFQELLRRALLIMGTVALVALAVGASGGVAGASTPSASWPQLHYGADRTGYQPNETKIGTGNVSRLAQARTYHAGAALSAPLIANGVLYVNNGLNLYAITK